MNLRNVKLIMFREVRDQLRTKSSPVGPELLHGE